MKKMLIRKAVIALSILMITSNSFAQTSQKWVIDKVHSTVKFSVSHLVISEVEGSFKAYDGSISNSKADFSDAKIDFTVDVASINTDNTMRDEHLKSDDFFNAKDFPKMTFKSTSIKKLAGNKLEITGDLTIRNTTKKVSFSATYGGTVKDAYGNTKSGFKATTSINRFDYGLKWNALTEAGGATVGKEISIVLNLEFALVK